MTKEVMKQALDALKNTTPFGFNMEADKRFYSAIEALEEALKQEQDEPVAYFDPQEGGFYWAKPTRIEAPITVDVEPLPLYLTPQQRCDECGNGGGYALYCLVCVEKYVKPEWVGLTDEEILTEWFKIFAPEPGIGKNVTNGVFEFAKAILKIAQESCNGFCGEIECKENKAKCKRQKTNET